MLLHGLAWPGYVCAGSVVEVTLRAAAFHRPHRWAKEAQGPFLRETINKELFYKDTNVM